METYLAHHGILGMKWGVRRYQNPDGSLTVAGEKRYNKPGSNKETSDSNGSLSKSYKKSLKLTAEESKRFDTIEKSANMAKSTIKTAEDEYKGEKLLRESETYRQKMLNKYAKDPKQKQNYERYKQMSKEDIQREFLRRENMKKAMIAGGAAVGIVAAGLIAYNMSVNKQLSLQKDLTKDTVGDILNSAAKDLDYVFSEGTRFNRQVGFEKFDVGKMAGKAMYVTTNQTDANTYLAFLRDFSGTGKRWQVDFNVKNKIVAPSDEKAKAIVKELWDTNPTYKDAVRKALGDTIGESRVDGFIGQKGPFYAAIWAICKQGDDAKILEKTLRDKGYNAILDYHDIYDGLSKKPLIIFEGDKNLEKVGETFITSHLRREAVKDLAVNGTAGIVGLAKNLSKMSQDEFENFFKANGFQ